MNKHLKGIILFIIYLIIIIYLSFIVYTFALTLIHFKFIFSVFVFYFYVAFSLLQVFKIQWLLLLIPAILIIKTSKNPFIIRLLTDLRLNNKLLLLALFFDIAVLIIEFNLIEQKLGFQLYSIYYSLTGNYLIIYLFTLFYNLKKKNSQ